MKTKIREYPHGLSIEVEPETPEEMAQLLRFANNVKAEKPSVSFHFSNTPICTVWMKKISESKQINTISNR